MKYVPKPAELDDGMDEEFKNIFHKFSFHETAATQVKGILLTPSFYIILTLCYFIFFRRSMSMT